MLLNCFAVTRADIILAQCCNMTQITLPLCLITNKCTKFHVNLSTSFCCASTCYAWTVLPIPSTYLSINTDTVSKRMCISSHFLTIW